MTMMGTSWLKYLGAVLFVTAAAAVVPATAQARATGPTKLQADAHGQAPEGAGRVARR